MGNVVRILVTAKDEISGTFDKIQDKASLLSKTDIGKGMLQGAGIAAFGAIQNAAYGALEAVGAFAAGSVAAAVEEEKGIARLNQSLTANIAGWKGNTDAIEGVIKAREKLAFSDGEQRDALSILVARTKDVNQALALERVAMDLARLKGIDLATASEVIGKVYSGNVGILTRYGIAVEKGATSVEALASVQKSAAGQAETFANTTEGAMQGAQVAIDDLQEEIGTKLLPVAKEFFTWVRDDGVPALEKVVGALDLVGQSARGVQIILTGGRSEVDLANQQWADMEQRVLAIQEAARAANPQLNRLAGSYHPEQTQEAADALHKLYVQVNKVGDSAGSTRRQMGRLQDAVGDAMDAFLEATLGPDELKNKLDIAKDSLGENTREVGKLQDKIARFKDAGKPTGELQDKLRDLRGEVIDGKGEVIRLTSRLEAMGQIKPGTTETTIERLIGRVAALKFKADDAYDSLRSVVNLQGTIGSSGGGGTGRGSQHRAAGGPASMDFLAGEGVNGAELIRLSPGVHATVNPSAAAASAGTSSGQPLVIQVNLDGRTVATVTAPYVTAWQQRNQLLARA